MNSLPLSGWSSMKGNGKSVRISSSASHTQRAARLCNAQRSVHPVHTSVTVRVKQHCPVGTPPSCPTRSSCTCPGATSCHSPKVRMGILSESAAVARVYPVPFSRIAARRGFSNRSTVAGLITANASFVDSLTRTDSWVSRNGSAARMTGTSRFPHRYPNNSHSCPTACCTSSLYTRGRRPPCGFTTRASASTTPSSSAYNSFNPHSRRMIPAYARV